MSKKQISAQIIADSMSPQGHRITTYILNYPRFIHGELMTHRMFSRNSASSRAIPFNKMVKMAEEDPFIPIAWQKDHKGMQGTEYFTTETFEIISSREKHIKYVDEFKKDWFYARDKAVTVAKNLSGAGVTKQICNRLLEPFMWHTVLLTATEFDNFFKLRCPKYHTPVSGDGFYFKSKKDCIANHSNPTNLKKLENMTEIEWLQINTSQAEIHIQALAEAMWDAMNESTPKRLKEGEWHVPFGDNIEVFTDLGDVNFDKFKIKVATARAARLSYMTFEGKIDYQKDIALHDMLLESKHMSPFEHCAKCPVFSINNESRGWEYGFTHSDINDNLWSGNFKGWIQYRHLLE